MLIYTIPGPSLTADRDGHVHVSLQDARNGDWDAFVSRSADSGRSWHRPRRLSDDAAGTGRHQYMGRVSVAENGRLDAIWYDRRDDPESRRNDVHLSSSDHHGRRFSPSVELTGDPCDSQVGPRHPIPSAAGLVEFGSRIALLSRPASALAAWTDTRNSDRESFQQDVFATEVEVAATEPAGHDEKSTVLPAVLIGAGAVSASAAALVLRRRARRRRSEAAA